MDLLLVLTEHFPLGVTAEALRANIDWKSAFFALMGSVWPNISGTTGHHHHHHHQISSALITQRP